MHILERKNKEPLRFNSAEEFFDHIMERHNNRTKLQKIADFIKYRIVWDYIHPLHPRRIHWRTKNFIQKIFWGFNDYELMDLDGEFSKWIIPKLKEYSTSDAAILKMIESFDLNLNMDDELDHSRPFNIEKYAADSKRLNKEMYEGLMLFVKSFRMLIQLEFDVVEWLLPRLKRFEKTVNGYPSGCFNEEGDFVVNEKLDFDEWKAILNDIITAFESIEFFESGASTQEFKNELYMKYVEKEINKGLNLFARYFNNLWT